MQSWTANSVVFFVRRKPRIIYHGGVGVKASKLALVHDSCINEIYTLGFV